MYSIAEGNPILNGEGWVPQQRMGFTTDSNLPTETEANAYTRDAVTETIVGTKAADHKPVVYTLPKNTSLEQPQKLESIVDVGMLQVRLLSCFMRHVLCSDFLDCCNRTSLPRTSLVSSGSPLR